MEAHGGGPDEYVLEILALESSKDAEYLVAVHGA